MPRHRYSKQRAMRLFAVVHDRLINVRLKILRGELEGYNRNKQEDLIYRWTKDLADEVVNTYKGSLKPEDLTMEDGHPDLGD